MDMRQGDQNVASAPRLRRRPVTAADFGPLVDLLTRGFPERPADYWRTAFARVLANAPRQEMPTYGFLLETDGVPVGVVLLIPMALDATTRDPTRCNLSSWYVDPAFRGYAALLIGAVLHNRDVTYVNISPAPHTRPVIEAQGFVCYAQGQLFAVPVLSRRRSGTRVRRIRPDDRMPESDLLTAHAACGCLSLVCETPDGPRPFVFRFRRIGRGLVPAAQLVYCRDIEDVVACAGALGLFLLRYGITCLIMDANGPMPGLIGKYYSGKAPKYVRGPHPPRLGDLAYTELALFGA